MTRYPPDIEKAVMASNRTKLLGTIADVQAAIRKANGKDGK